MPFNQQCAMMRHLKKRKKVKKLPCACRHEITQPIEHYNNDRHMPFNADESKLVSYEIAHDIGPFVLF